MLISGKITSCARIPFSDFTEEMTTIADSGAETILTDLEIMATFFTVSQYLYARL